MIQTSSFLDSMGLDMLDLADQMHTELPMFDDRASEQVQTTSASMSSASGAVSAQATPQVLGLGPPSTSD